MKIISKRFTELDTLELFEIYKLRQEVFIVEQACNYNDIDVIDKKAWHILGVKDEELVAYARVFSDENGKAHIGRVLSKYRKKGFGRAILKDAIAEARKHFPGKRIEVEAQSYVKDLYQKLGFEQVSEEFLDVGIPHVRMVLENKGDKMLEGEKKFEEFYMRMVAEGKEEEAKVLLKESFDKQAKGEFSKDYIDSVQDRYFELVREEEREALKQAMDSFTQGLK